LGGPGGSWVKLAIVREEKREKRDDSRRKGNGVLEGPAHNGKRIKKESNTRGLVKETEQRGCPEPGEGGGVNEHGKGNSDKQLGEGKDIDAGQPKTPRTKKRHGQDEKGTLEDMRERRGTTVTGCQTPCEPNGGAMARNSFLEYRDEQVRNRESQKGWGGWGHVRLLSGGEKRSKVRKKKKKTEGTLSEPLDQEKPGGKVSDRYPDPGS